MNKKVSVAGVMLIIAAAGVFAASCWSLFNWSEPVTISLFTVQALLLLIFTLVGLKKPVSADPTAAADPKPFEEMRIKLDKLTSENAELKTEIASVRAESDNYRSKVGELNARIENSASVAHTLLYDEKLLEDEEDIDLREIANDTAQQMKPYADRADIRLSVAGSDHIIYHANARLMNIMMRNIVDNSIKYMRRAGNIHITLSVVDDDVFIICKDDGMGIGADELKYIFDLNFQGSNRVSGNGLGLTQAKDIVTAYNGVIYAKSNMGAGMGIYIQLPLSGRKERA